MHAGYFLTRAAERYSDRPAWMDAQRVVTFRQAAARVGRLAQGLLSLGGQPGDRVGLLVPNCPEGLEAILGPMQAGMAVVPMNSRLLPDEHAYMLNDSGAFTLIYAEDVVSHVARMRERLDTVKHFICIRRNTGGDLSYEALLEEQKPKGAMLTHRVLSTMAEQFLLDIDPAAHRRCPSARRANHLRLRLGHLHPHSPRHRQRLPQCALLRPAADLRGD